jgi:hypothetical protein
MFQNKSFEFQYQCLNNGLDYYYFWFLELNRKLYKSMNYAFLKPFILNAVRKFPQFKNIYYLS